MVMLNTVFSIDFQILRHKVVFSCHLFKLSNGFVMDFLWLLFKDEVEFGFGVFGSYRDQL